MLSCAAVSGVALAGLVVGTGSASAMDAWVCRGDYASEPGGVHIHPCLVIDGTNVRAWIDTSVDAGGASAYPCAQLWTRNLGGGSPWVFMWDLGCEGKWIDPGNGYGTWGDRGALNLVNGGDYVLRTGYWATLNGQYGYYGDVESPVVTFE